MIIGESINKLRTAAGFSQEQFAMLFDVSQQSVQKWESGDSTPSLDKLIQISKHFGVSLDALILGNDNRVVEEMKNTNIIKPQYENINQWEFYSSNLITEYQQSIDEGLDIEKYKDVFESVFNLPLNEIKDKLGNVLFEAVQCANQQSGYKYIEPSDLDTIKKLRKPFEYERKDRENIEEKNKRSMDGKSLRMYAGQTHRGHSYK